MNARRTTSPFDNGGFTLVEVMMAMLILTVGLLGLLQSIQIAFQHDARNRLREEAVLLAEEQLNNMKSRPYGKITNDSMPVVRSIAGGTKTFQVTRTFAEMSSNGYPNKSKKLTVAVAWSFRNVSTIHEIYTVKSE